VVKKILRAYV